MKAAEEEGRLFTLRTAPLLVLILLNTHFIHLPPRASYILSKIQLDLINKTGEGLLRSHWQQQELKIDTLTGREEAEKL